MEIRNGEKVFTKSFHEPSKSRGMVKPTEDVSAVDALVTFEQIAETKLTSVADPKICVQGKSVGNCEDEETDTAQNVSLETIDLGSFEVLRWMEMNLAT